MRVVNTKFETITEYDLTKGRLSNVKAPKEGVTPLGTEIVVKTTKGKEIKKKKRYYTPEELEDVQMYIPFPEPTLKEKIKSLKSKLAATDYKVIKCSECQLLGEEMPYDVAALHAERQTLRNQINELEAQLCQS